MTEVTPRNSAMVREPTTTIHSGEDESGSSGTKMPDLSETQKLLLSQAVNRSPPSGGDLKQVDSSNASHSDSCSEAEDLKSERKEEVPSNNNEEESTMNSKNTENNSWSMASDLTGKVQELHETLTRLRAESDDQIQRLRKESEDASKTIEKLQMQLQQQADYDSLKREVQFLKSMGSKIGPPSSSLTPPPGIPPTSMAGNSPSSGNSNSGPPSLELLLVERAKALQANPAALKAFADMQGGPASFPGLGGPLRHPLIPGAMGGLDPTALGLMSNMNEDVLNQWRRSIEQGPLGGLGLPGSPLTPPTSSGPPVSSGRKTPTSPTLPRDPTDTPSNGRSSTPGQDENSNLSRATPVTNGAEGPKSEDGGASPPRAESKSPAAPKAESPSSPLAPLNLPNISTAAPFSLSTPTPSQLTASIAGHFPPLTNPMSLPLPLSVPPLMSTSRIPKSDPMEAKLQDMLRYNMEKFAGQPLDTLGMSRRVRELLSIHNIGQRLFAKYVLGLSQGTVSELLSKPKSWDKLTEKGRDSYRKMHAWAYDDNAIMLLKSLIPRKGELMRPVSHAAEPSAAAAQAAALLMKEDRPNPPSLGPTGFPYGQNGNEERIAKILSEANKAMAAGVAAAASKDSVVPITSAAGQTLPSGNEGETPQERMSKLYQEELSRLMQSQKRAALQGAGAPVVPGSEGPKNPDMPPGLPGLFPGLAGGLFQRAQQSDLQRAMDVYQQEFSRIQQNAFAAAIRAQHQNGKEVADQDSRAKTETPNPPQSPATSTGGDINTKSPGATRQESPLGKGPGSGLFPPADVDLVGSLSPLQRMASITNSLVSQPNMPGQQQMNRPNRAALPPITQQQFDRFSHLNTDEVVRRVKDILSQYSISQRLFGESVLGLSQGSVSDLLARPKPWHMLTQKGREPFIRMKLFLDDENAVHKLVASQYKIAPEKLMRTGSYGGNMQFNPAVRPGLPKIPDIPRSLPDAPILPSSLRFGQESLMDRTGPILDPSLLLQRQLLSKKIGGPAGLMGPQSLVGAPSQSLYEMAALTHEMDTQAVTTKVKEILLANNIGQKLFGEHVLGLSQGSVSELLAKPKPWHMLSIKGREPFIRMQLWLNDPTSIEKLQNYKKDVKDGGNGTSKRKRSFPGGPGSGMGDSGSDRSSPAGETDPYSADSPGSNSAKKSRVYFTDEQKEALKIAFALDPYPSTASMDFLSTELNLESRSISNWFHNHRMRLKQQLPQGMDNFLSKNEGSGTTFDPVKFRLLLHQRMLEMQNPDDVANNSSVANLLRQFSSFQQSPGSPSMDLGSSSGLDLSYKRDDEDDKDSIAESNDNNNEDEQQQQQQQQQQQSSSRSRRKPAAPQWVRPEWNKVPDNEAAGNSNGVDKSDLTINGVCVMNYNFKEENNEDKIEDSTNPAVTSEDKE